MFSTHLALTTEPVNSQHEHVDTRLSYQSIFQQSTVRRDVSRSEMPSLALRMRFRYARSSSTTLERTASPGGGQASKTEPRGHVQTTSIKPSQQATKQAEVSSPSSLQYSPRNPKAFPPSDDPSHITRRIYLPIHPSIMRSPLNPLFLTLTFVSLQPPTNPRVDLHHPAPTIRRRRELRLHTAVRGQGRGHRLPGRRLRVLRPPAVQ